MKTLLLICVYVVSAASAPIPNTNTDAQADIIQSENKSDGKGNYEFSFETSNGIRRSESGTLVNEGQPDEHIAVLGFYSYTDPDGKIVKINYTADENGYHIIIFPGPVVVSAPPAVLATLLG